jgi:hypothetical protein
MKQTDSSTTLTEPYCSLSQQASKLQLLLASTLHWMFRSKTIQRSPPTMRAACSLLLACVLTLQVLAAPRQGFNIGLLANPVDNTSWVAFNGVVQPDFAINNNIATMSIYMPWLEVYIELAAGSGGLAVQGYTSSIQNSNATVETYASLVHKIWR